MSDKSESKKFVRMVDTRDPMNGRLSVLIRKIVQFRLAEIDATVAAVQSKVSCQRR